MIPYPFDKFFGFEHKKVKELSGATAFTFVLLYYQPNLNDIMKYLATRWANTFSGRSFLEAIKLLFKPAPVPTIIESSKTPPPPPPNKTNNNKTKNNNNNNNQTQ